MGSIAEGVVNKPQITLIDTDFTARGLASLLFYRKSPPRNTFLRGLLPAFQCFYRNWRFENDVLFTYESFFRLHGNSKP
jgi:hypothetical protein